MSSSNCCFFTCIQISQEAGEVVWDSHLFQNFSQFVLIHSKRLWLVKKAKVDVLVYQFWRIKKAKVDVFLELSCFFNDTMLAIWSLVLLPFLNPNWTSGSSWFMYCWSLAWRILSITFTTWDECNCSVVWNSLAMPLFGTGMKTDIFQSRGHCWGFQICWHNSAALHSIISQDLKAQLEFQSPPRTLFLVMLPDAHLTWHSRMSGSQWVITLSWLSGSWRSFLYSSSLYSCTFFSISSASVRSIAFLSFILPVCMKCSLGISDFLEEILKRLSYGFYILICWYSVSHWLTFVYWRILAFLE